jgi:hypothetical protein
MPTEFFEVDKPFVVAFAMDADLNFTEIDAYQTTKRKVEGKGTISDFVASQPLTATVEGKITAMNLDPLSGAGGTEKLSTARDNIKALAAKAQPVIVINDTFAEYMVITRVERVESADGGKAINLRIALEQLEQTTVGTAQVPASRLRAKVKRKAGAGKKGGAAKGSKPDQSRGAAIDDALNRGVSGMLGGLFR